MTRNGVPQAFAVATFSKTGESVIATRTDFHVNFMLRWNDVPVIKSLVL